MDKKKWKQKQKQLRVVGSSSPVELCAAIELLMRQLEIDGFKIYDFDNKSKVVKQVRIIGNKAYFLAEQEGI